MGEAESESEGKLNRDGVKYAPFYRSFDQVAQNLSDVDRLALYDAVNNYCFRDVYPCFSDKRQFPNVEKPELLENCFAIMAPVLESTLKKMVGGSKGGRPKKAR